MSLLTHGILQGKQVHVLQDLCPDLREKRKQARAPLKKRQEEGEKNLITVVGADEVPVEGSYSDHRNAIFCNSELNVCMFNARCLINGLGEWRSV